MKRLTLAIALAHLRGRRRQTMVSVLGVTLGVGVFIGISGLMHGFQEYFLTQLIETNPHVLITDEIRRPAAQPLTLAHPDAAVEVRRVLPPDPKRGIPSAGSMLESLNAMQGVIASPVLRGQMILRRAGRDVAVSAVGIDPLRELQVINISKDIKSGSMEALAAQKDGAVVGDKLADKLGATVGDTVAVATASGAVSTLKLVGLFHTGIEQQDTGMIYIPLTLQQALQSQPRVVNEIHIRLAEIGRSIPIAQVIENRWGYKTAPWEETLSRILDVFVLQNAIIYLTTGSILVVAGFGIFNIISTIVMEKARDIAIMRSIGMPAADVVNIFIFEGLVVGVAGVVCGCALGWGIGAFLGTLPAPGATDPSEHMRVSMTATSYLAGSAIALVSSVAAAWLPARRGAQTDPLAIIRGAS